MRADQSFSDCRRRLRAVAGRRPACTLSTESEFSTNDQAIMLDAGKNYFYRQFVKMGLIKGGADLEVISEAQAKDAIAKLELASGGACSGVYAPSKR